MFRSGNWCYSGSVDFDIQYMQLNRVNSMLKIIQEAQGDFKFECEADAMPAESKYAKILQKISSLTPLLETQIAGAVIWVENLIKMVKTGAGRKMFKWLVPDAKVEGVSDLNCWGGGELMCTIATGPYRFRLFSSENFGHL